MAKGKSKVKTEAEKKAAFKSAAEKKANTALRAIAGLAKLTNPNKFSHTADQVNTLKSAFKEHLDAAFDALDGKKVPTGGIEL